MLIYAESSAVLAWLLGEPTQHEILKVLRAAEGVFCSRLTLLECSRGVVVAEQLRRINAVEGNKVRRLWRQAARGWSVLDVTREVCERAERPFPKEPIRSLDAIHLSSLLILHSAEPRIQPLTLDRRVRDNAVDFGFAPLP